MTINRIRNWSYPERIRGMPETEEFLRKHYTDHVNESRERIQDFDILQLSNVPWIDARKYGASPLATAAVNDVAIAASIADLDDYGTWKLPGGQYDVSSLITFSTKRFCNIIFEGSLSTTGCSGVLFDDVKNSRIHAPVVQLSARDWTSGYYGARVKDFEHNNIFLRSTSNFQYAYFFDGDTDPVAYNNFYFEESLDCKFGFYFSSTNNGFVNENNYYGGRIGLNGATKTATADSYGVWFIASPSHTFNNHRFYGTCFENLHNGIGFASASHIILEMPRFESVDANWVQCHSGGLEHFIWILGPEDFDETKVNINKNTKGFLILGAGTHDSNYKTIITDKYDGGLSFVSRSRIASDVAHFYYRTYDANTFMATDNFGVTQRLNKSHESATIPTSGSFRENAIVWNTNIAAGQYRGWICSVKGTAGTLASVTGSIDSGSKKLTVNDASNLNEGMFIAIVGVTGTKNIDYIENLDVYLYTVSDATASSAAVSYSNPTWETLEYVPLEGSLVWNPASLADGAGETSSGITVTGAAVGDAIQVFPPYDMQDFTYSGYVQAANTVEIRIQNESGGVVDLASGTWKVKVHKY